MKKLKCEICNGSNLLKDNGIYICQDCGVKYSVEEAQKIWLQTSNAMSGEDEEKQ